MKVLNLTDADYDEAVKLLEAAETFARDVSRGKISTYGAADVRYGIRWVRTLLELGKERGSK